MNSITDKSHFLKLLQTALGTANYGKLSWSPVIWQQCREEARKHAVEGICAPATQDCPPELRLKWLYATSRCEENNKRLVLQGQQLCAKFNGDGRACCILKGQSVAQWYPNPAYRQSGDIDIWVTGDRKELVSMIRRVTRRKTWATYHHADFDVFPDTSVELHFTPTWMFCPWHNLRLQRWFVPFAPQLHVSADGPYLTPIEFDVIFILLHIYRHVFDQGVGLRQVVDYFYVLRAHYQKYGHVDMSRLLNNLGLLRFARGLMWLLRVKLLMPSDWMITEDDEYVGEWLYRDIMDSGNMGHAKECNQGAEQYSRLTRFFWRFQLLSERIWMFPLESFCEMPWRIWHYFWRRKNNYL